MLCADKAPFRHLIYPMPESWGLGVHLTLDLHGSAKFGPDVEWLDTVEYNVDEQLADKFYSIIRLYWPGLPDGALTPSYSGIRSKVCAPQLEVSMRCWLLCQHHFIKCPAC